MRPPLCDSNARLGDSSPPAGTWRRMRPVTIRPASPTTRISIARVPLAMLSTTACSTSTRTTGLATPRT